MSKPLRSKLFLLTVSLLACSAPPTSAPPSSAPPAGTVTIAPPPAAHGEQAGDAQAGDAEAVREQKAINNDEPGAKEKSEAEAVTEVVEGTIRDLEQAWCTSPPKAGCEAIKAFAAAGVPVRPKSATFTLGTEVDTTGSFVVLRFAPEGNAVPRMAASAVRPDDAAEEAEAMRYIGSIGRGKRDLKSPVHAFLEHPAKNERFMAAREAERGFLLEGHIGLGGTGLQLLRQKEGKLYLLSINVDSRPRSYERLAVFPAP